MVAGESLMARFGSLQDRLRSRFSRLLVKGRSDGLLVLLDALMVAVAYLLSLTGRFDLAVPEWAWSGMRTFLPVAICVHVFTNLLARLYGPIWKQASIVEARRVLIAGVAATMVLIPVAIVGAPLFVPLSVVIIGGGLATGLLGLVRFQSRLFALRRRGESGGGRVLIVGAGDAAGALLREMARHPTPFEPVAILDDDVRKRGRRLAQVPIVGAVADLEAAARSFQVDQILLAVPSADSQLVRRVAEGARALEIPLKVLPSVDEMVNGRPRIQDVRDLSIDDLLGRQQIRTDLAAVARMIEGRRVLVTGGGGSIGSEIVRQVARYEPARLVVLDRDETHLFDAGATVEECVAVLLDIRDRAGVEEVFGSERPEIVFHAAANKHVPLLEAHPREAAANNVIGTRNVVEVASEVGVEHLVFVSTDKAVNPTSVMGASKRLAEHLVLTAAPAGAAWCAVRFGNVLGSRGSVVPTFVRQIRLGGPVTITHPDMTRFFMSISEAVQLVLQAAAMAQGREVFMLDMGEPVRILDLAHRMIHLAGHEIGVDIEVQITGIRPGEKLEEELYVPQERPQATEHAKIMRLHPVRTTDAEVDRLLARLTEALHGRDDACVRELLLNGLPSSTAIPTLQPPLDAIALGGRGQSGLMSGNGGAPAQGLPSDGLPRATLAQPSPHRPSVAGD